jgi:hypothetical protein
MKQVPIVILRSHASARCRPFQSADTVATSVRLMIDDPALVHDRAQDGP